MATKCHDCGKEITKGVKVYRSTYGKGKKVAYCRNCYSEAKARSDTIWRMSHKSEPKKHNGLPWLIH